MVEQVAESFRLIYFSIAEEVFATVLAVVEGQEDSLYDVLHVYERDVLALEANGEVDVLTDAFCHQEIVFLARTIYPRGT